MIIHALHTENNDLVAVVDDVISIVAIKVFNLSIKLSEEDKPEKDIMKHFILLFLFAVTAVIQGDPTLGTTAANPATCNFL